jgi:dihydroneopterin aldolase
LTPERTTVRRSAPSGWHRASLTVREALLFEAGVKLGGVFHQYLGTPVSGKTATQLERTIERAVALQPFVRSIRVRIRPDREGPTGTGKFAYHYLTARMLDVEVTLGAGNEEVVATLKMRPRLRYPLMSVLRARRSPARRR